MPLYLFLFFILFSSSGQASEYLCIESDKVRYEGKDIYLEGNARIEHPIGIVTGHNVHMHHDDKKWIELKEQIKISFRKGGELECAQAKIDCDQLTGSFLSNEMQPEVIYLESNLGRNHLRIKSKVLNLNLFEEDKTLQVQKLIAEEGVSVKYHDLFKAFGDKLTYEKSSAQKKNAGSIELQGKICRIETLEGDLIFADHIHIDVESKHSRLTFPRGKLHTLAKEEVQFSANKMEWNELQHDLVLEENVVITQQGIGQVLTNDKVIFKKEHFNGKNQVRTITLQGESILSYEEAEKRLSAHKLTCYGNLEIDRQTFKTNASSPLDQKGNVLENKQVHYVDAVGEIYANQFSVTYEQKVGKKIPSHILFSGNVYICNQGNSLDSLLCQYIMADQVEYFPQTKEMHLTAKKGKRVLFYDRVDNLQVSAPALKITRDLITKKESIQGIGDVRFNFIEHEFDKLKSRFLFDKVNKA